MKTGGILGWLTRPLAFLAVIGILALAVAILFYALYEIVELIIKMAEDFTQKDKIIASSLSAVDLILLGITVFLIGIGLFELFVSPIPDLPDWLTITNIDQLKTMLVKLAIVVMAISFTGTIITWDRETDLTGYGISLGAVIFALSYFLRGK